MNFFGKQFRTECILAKARTTELSQKVHYSYNQAIKNGVNEAILLMRIKEALFSK